MVDFANFNQPPHWPYIFGTDLVGRDIFTRIIFAYRISLILGVVVLAIAVPIGVTIGLVAGYFGGWIEYVLMRITDVFLSIPPLVLAMSMMGLLAPTLTNGMIAVTAMWWPWYTRLVYNLTRSEKEEGYVLAAEVIGASQVHIMFREILPNCVPSILDQDDARSRLRHPHRVLALLPRPRRAAADARPRHDGRRRGANICPTPGGSPCSPASPSCSPCSASTCSAIPCAIYLESEQ